jgi:hypothetical protein
MKLLKSILSYLPAVLAGVVAVEGTIGQGNGSAKKAVILSAIDAAAQVGEQVPEQHVQAISALIDTTVKALNGTGFFQTTKPQA